MLALSGASLAFTLGPSAVTHAHPHRSPRAVMLGGLFGQDDPKAKKKVKNVDDNGLLPFDFPELPDLPKLPKVPDALITTWWTKAFAPVVDAIPGYTRGEGIAIPGLGFLGNVPLWFIFGYLGPFVTAFALGSYPVVLKIGNRFLPDLAPDVILAIDEKFPLVKDKKGEIADVAENEGITLKARTKAKAVKAKLEKEAKAKAEAAAKEAKAKAEAQALAQGATPEEAKLMAKAAAPAQSGGKKLSEKLGETDLKAAKAASTYLAKGEAVAKAAEEASRKGAKAELEAKAANKAREAQRKAAAAKAAEKAAEEKAARAAKADAARAAAKAAKAKEAAATAKVQPAKK